MAALDLSVVPETHRDLASDALQATFGEHVTDVRTVRGGASGALTYRVATSTGDHLLRMEANQSVMRNPTQYACMRTAAEIGIAPPARHLDADAGVVIMPFIEQRPIAELGTPDEIAAATAQLLAQLHAASPFPSNGDYLDNMRRALAYLESSGRVVPGLLDAHAEALDEISAAYPWRPETFVSAHNDPNPANVLFDGERLWLIDWETAALNDPYVDLAIAANNHTLVADVSEAMLGAYLGAGVDDVARARMALMQIVVRLWSGVMLLVLIADPDVPQHADLSALSPQALMDEVASGRMPAQAPSTTHAFAKLMLQLFLDGARTPDAARWRSIATSDA